MLLLLLVSPCFAKTGLFQNQIKVNEETGLFVKFLGAVRDLKNNRISDFVVFIFSVTAREDMNLEVNSSPVFNRIGHEFKIL